jgi:transposase
MTDKRQVTRWTRAFKLQALARMEDAPDIKALAIELGVQRMLLYRWRQIHRSGGEQALHQFGRVPRGAKRADDVAALPPAPASGSLEEQNAALLRKIGEQQLDLDFFRAALKHTTEQRRSSDVRGEAAST